MKILTVVGARPQFIKAAPLSRALRAAGLVEVLLHTGQHYDRQMSEVFFSELGLNVPDYNLGVGSASHGAQTAAMLAKIEAVVVKEKPLALLIYGDTNSTLAGALAASKLGVPVAHVEAGLRSYNRAMPEEINRVVADALSQLLFCPSAVAAENLGKEGIVSGVYLVGDVMYDAVRWATENAAGESTFSARTGLAKGEYVLATVHRASNTDDVSHLSSIVDALNGCGKTVLFPVHPRTRRALDIYGLRLAGNVVVHEPLSYLEMLAAEAGARAILTDSGGVQKEAYWLSVPCVTLRDETEWVETVESGWNRLAGCNTDSILDALQMPPPPATIPNAYGDGHASEQIALILAEYLEGNTAKHRTEVAV